MVYLNSKNYSEPRRDKHVLSSNKYYLAQNDSRKHFRQK